jgi:hypothetical protein
MDSLIQGRNYVNSIAVATAMGLPTVGLGWIDAHIINASHITAELHLRDRTIWHKIKSPTGWGSWSKII